MENSDVRKNLSRVIIRQQLPYTNNSIGYGIREIHFFFFSSNNNNNQYKREDFFFAKQLQLEQVNSCCLRLGQFPAVSAILSNWALLTKMNVWIERKIASEKFCIDLIIRIGPKIWILFDSTWESYISYLNAQLERERVVQ